MLVDTDVLIWHFRGNPKAAYRLNGLPLLMISAITWMELLQGFRNRAEMLAVQKSLTQRQIQRLPLTPQITHQAIELMENLSLSHGLQLGDALIAATAITHDLPLLTANVKHFAAVRDLQLAPFLP